MTTLAIGQQLPVERPVHQPWPTIPKVHQQTTADAEGGARAHLASTVEFLGDEHGRVRALRVAETEYREDGTRGPKAGTEREVQADLVLLALGFTGIEEGLLTQQLGVHVTRGLVARKDGYETDEPGVFACGDAGRGASLVVWAIAEGRACAQEVDESLERWSRLPHPVDPDDRGLVLG